jgi:uncharacterized protein YjbI with pentapeptide repeats
MLATRLEGVDLTNAHIENTWIINSNMSKSILTKATVLGNSFFRKVDLSGADTSDITLVNTSFYMVNVSGVVTNNFYLQGLINHAKKSSKFSSLLRNVELTGVFSTTSGIDLAATKTMLEEVGASPNGHPADPGAGCTIS